MRDSARKICTLQVVMSRNVVNWLSMHHNTGSNAKIKLITYLKKLIEEGYRCFIVYVGGPIDFWTAETIWEYSKTIGNNRIRYSLVFITSIVNMENKWIDAERNWKEVTENAQEIVWQKEFYPIHNAVFKLIDLSKE